MATTCLVMPTGVGAHEMHGQGNLLRLPCGCKVVRLTYDQTTQVNGSEGDISAIAGRFRKPTINAREPLTYSHRLLIG